MTEADFNELETRANTVINSCDGIQPTCDVFYLHSILYSAERSISSFNEYEYFLEKNHTNANDLVGSIQEAIGHAAAVSKYFWPNTNNKTKQSKLISKRGKKLSQHFNLTRVSPLNNRSLRNAWEHFDEHLDTYLLKKSSGNFFPDSIIGDHELASLPTNHIFKLIDISEECLVLLNNKYFFRPIREEIEVIFSIASEKIKNGGRL